MEKVNIVVSFIIFVMTSAIIIRLFTEESSIVYKWSKFVRETIRVSLVIVGLGSIWNCFKIQPTPASEVLLNIGLAILFTWVFLFHHKFQEDETEV